jgi:heterodisulfide reductase subunit A-like polyferredoxin
VVTSQELEAMLIAGSVVRPSTGAPPGRVLFIQCAGSRDDNHLRYCSSECCTTTLRQVYELRTIDPKVEIAVVYRDIRAPGQLEHLFIGVQKMAGMMMTRGDVDRVKVNGRLSVELSNSLLGERGRRGRPRGARRRDGADRGGRRADPQAADARHQAEHSGAGSCGLAAARSSPTMRGMRS